jgi:hypothetical protein
MHDDSMTVTKKHLSRREALTWRKIFRFTLADRQVRQKHRLDNGLLLM